ncbi:OsmC family protein [Salinispora tropica]|uniref:OsmC family protein n=1 Tax=Salinispora tropica (strain ATCC BAA-916 / DSM 44818 / JCM 13857 / NBRC 105044 / CNB-440) TaxID=369723 RepID=A4XBV6_SALTO|nr:OsmC family protein [Salinispora tropica]ABP56413.1 OsmC family protein [Salinispora tropica CNB-440]
MNRTHTYEIATTWTGDRGRGTADYRAYDRSYDTVSPGRPLLAGSADPAFRGDPRQWNPELLLVASLSQCHLLWYLHLCAVNEVVVVGYHDAAHGTMREDGTGAARFTDVLLRPVVTVTDVDMVKRATKLHVEANARCFIAASVSFPVRHEARTTVRLPPPELAS